MKKYFDVLRRCKLFNGIADENLLPVMSCLNVTVQKFGKKETVIADGDDIKNIGIILKGSVNIEQLDYFGNRSIMAKVGESELFGETFSCAGVEKSPVSVVAQEACEIMLVDCIRLLKTCSNACEFHRRMIYNLMRVLATKNMMFHQKIEITSKRTTREKLITYLLFQAKSAGSSSFTIPYDRQQLADYLEVDRSGLSAEISKLRNEGFLESQKNKFKLLSSEMV